MVNQGQLQGRVDEKSHGPFNLSITKSDYSENEAPLIELLNSPFFDVPEEVGIPEEKYGEWPDDATGKPGDKYKSPSEINEEFEENPPDDGDRQEELDETNDTVREILDFTYNRGTPDGSTTMEDPSQPVHTDPPSEYPSPSIAVSGVKFVVGRPKGKKTTDVQTVIFKKDNWTLDKAKKWLKDNKFKSTKVDETEDSFRFRQRNPGDFEKDSFRTIAPGKSKEASMDVTLTMVEKAGDAIADVIVESAIRKVFTSPIIAYYALFEYMECGKQPPIGIIEKAAKWTRKYINDLPDGAFAIIEPAYTSGKAEDKNARHLPHHDASVSSSEKPTPNGAVDKKSIDLPHLRNALARVNQIKPVTDSISKEDLVKKASAHLDKHAKALGLGERDEAEKSNLKEEAVSKTQQANGNEAVTLHDPSGKDLFEPQGPNDPETFPGGEHEENEEASLSIPKGSPAPKGEGPNDPDTFPSKSPGKPKLKENPAPSVKGPGGLTPTPGPNDAETFPEDAGMYAAGLENLVPPGPQSPEYERHNPYQKERRLGNPGGPRAPWDRLSQYANKDFKPDATPGLEYLANAKDLTDKDAHVSKLEQLGQEIDLFHKRFAKHANMSDLESATSRFQEMRGMMSQIEQCQMCQANKGAVSYAKELFGYAYGQVRHGMTRALRQFTEKDANPDMVVYHKLMALKADLMGPETSKFLSSAHTPTVVMSDYDLELYMTGSYGVKKVATAAKKDGEDPEKNGGDDDMKKEDVEQAVKISMSLLRAGLIREDQFEAKVLKLASMTPDARQEALEMAQTLTAEPILTAGSETDEKANPSAVVANKNLVGNGVATTPGERVNGGSQNPSLMGIFASRRKAHIFSA